MQTLAQLSHSEKVFLAGCIRAVILSDGNIEEAELEDLDRIYRSLDFGDYEACLDEFEKNVTGEDAFMSRAKEIDNHVARDIILKTVYDLSLQNGVPVEEQETLFRKLNRVWRER